jgi:hypothetical protein
MNFISFSFREELSFTIKTQDWERHLLVQTEDQTYYFIILIFQLWSRQQHPESATPSQSVVRYPKFIICTDLSKTVH